MERTFARTCSLVLCLFVIVSSSQRFDLPAASSGSRGLRLDGDGRVYVSSGRDLYRLSSNLVMVERRNLTSEAVNITLSSDGRWLVVCLSDRSCEVYNATNLSADDQPVYRREGAIESTENVALFAAEESFYVGSISARGSGVQEKIKLGQYGFAGSQVGVAESGEYIISASGFERNMYGGFVRGDYAYYFVVDNNPSNIRNFRVMRVCHNSNFRALYELSLFCTIRRPSTTTRISGVSLVDNFGGISGPTVVLSRNRPQSSQNNLCLYSLDEIDRLMAGFYNTCLAGGSELQIDVAWRNTAAFCNELSSFDVCDFGGALEALDDIETRNLMGDVRVSYDGGTSQFDFLTASVGALVESLPLVFLSYMDENDDSYIIGHDAGSTANSELGIATGFDRRLIADGPVRQLQLNAEARLIYAVTDTSVLQFPITNCSSHSTCTSCLSGNPLCGWCVVENKCSEISECQNSDNDTRWIRAARNTEQCPTISVTPQQYVLDNPMTITLTLSQRLPTLLDGEAYRCHFAGGGPTFMVDAVGANTSYSCNITGRLPSLQGLSTVYDVSFISSLAQIPFSTSVGALTVYQCGQTSSCSACLQTNNACGWCVYNKLCRGTSDECINGTDNYLQPNLGMSETFMDVCPLLAPPSTGQNYTQPVRESGTIELVTRNLPPAIPGFTYWCEVNGIQLDATYNNETSLTCTVDANELTLSGDIGQQAVDVNIRWVGQGISHPIDASTPVSVNLFSCGQLADGCSSCLGSGFECTWCSRMDTTTSTCTYTGTCEATSISMGNSCPGPSITSFNPTSGPVEGGTTIAISGRELGVSFDDFSANSITVGGVPCTPTDRQSYVPGRQINCITTAGGTTGSKVIMVTLPSGTFTTSDLTFRVATPQISRVTPSLGPVAGGTRVTVFGTDLDIGNIEDTRITLVGGGMCEVNRSSIQADSINCTTPMFTGSPGTNGLVTVNIDSAMITDGSVQFMYAPNPEFYSVSPSNTILAGGIELIFNGSNLNSVQNPELVIRDSNFEVNRSVCTVLNSTTIRCITPSLTRRLSGSGNGLTYTIMVDNAPGPDPNSVGLQISVSPNPGNFELIDSEYNTGSTNLIRITGTNIDSVRDEDYSVTVGGEVCTITAITPTEINCAPPSEPPGSTNQAEVVVSVGAYLSETLDQPLAYIAAATLPLQIIIPAVVGSVVVVMILSLFIICCVVCYHRKKSRKNEQRWTNLLSQMELMELEMADECKRAFTELQTDLADLVQISDANLPYRDFRSFAMRFLFPQAGKDHPVLLPLQLPEKSEPDDVVENLKSFQSLIMDKKFLLVFIHTLEAQGPNFTLQDKCTVASLLMVAFQNDLDYATDVLQTLLSELMRKSLNNKTHPKLLLRRTESVAEKMLANWLAFLLYPYLLEHVGQPLFTLYRAIKSQLEKGPVDVISGEARHSLSEEKLLRHSIEVKSIEGIVEPESGEDIPIKMLDCDSITQAKEKVLDALYKNCPASKRPQLTEVDLILQCGTAQLTLRDQDQTNRREGDWTKVNTLGHYNVDEMSQKHRNNPKLPIPRFKLEKRPERPISGASFDALGTIIANIGTESRANLMMSGELSHIFHLVKPEADEGDESVEKRGKIMSEVFLTRLLSTKRILQPYVDAVFEAIFTIPQGRQLPKAVKSLFDFLDLQASDLGIQDHEILHTWKTNSVPLRFWVNIIKNPDFVFDLHKSVTVDSCLTVIAQAYIDACSTAEMKYTKETPSARLLYVNEVKKYKQDVQTYYNSVQSQPKLSQYEMGEYLRETAQVCANSVLQVEPDLDTKDLGPSSMTRQLYFVTESALLELFKFASEYSADIVDGLNEEGLSIMATNFQQLKKSIPA